MDDTRCCPRGARCEACGDEHPRVAVHTVALARLGVACLTMCPRCAGSDTAPPVSLPTAGRLVAAHARHLANAIDHMHEEPR